MKLIRTIVLMLIAAGAAIVADRTYRARTNPSSAEWIEDAKFDRIVIEHLQFDREPLAGALRKLSEKSGVGIVLDLSSLQRVGFGPDAPVSVVLDHVSLSEAMNQTLRSLQQEFPTKLDYTLERGSIFVTTEYEIQSHPMLRVYQIEDIVDAILKSNPPDPPQSISAPQAQNLFGGGRPMMRQDAVDMVVRCVEDCVASESWQDNGGTSGRIRELNGRLFVLQTWRMHQDIARLFRDIHGAAATSAESGGRR